MVVEMAAASEGLGSNTQLQEKDGDGGKTVSCCCWRTKNRLELDRQGHQYSGVCPAFPQLGSVGQQLSLTWELVTGWRERSSLDSFLPAAQEVAGCFQSLNRELGGREARQKLKTQWVPHSTMVAKIQHFSLCF